MPTLAPIFANNDFALKAKLKDIDEVTGIVSPLLTGTVTAFLATSSLPTATAADPTLSVTATTQGGGIRLVFFDATILLPSLLDGLFAATPPYCIIVYPSGIRAVVACAYQASRTADVSA
jgi:hypothetical protein